MKTDAQFKAAVLRLWLAAEAVWIVGALLMVLLLTGCQTNEKQSHQVPMPPMPRTTRSSAGGEVGHVARAVSAPAGPRTIKLEWDKNDLHPETVTQVWASGDLVNWILIGEFAEPRCEVPADQAQQFYKVRNRLGNELSDWARK